MGVCVEMLQLTIIYADAAATSEQRANLEETPATGNTHIHIYTFYICHIVRLYEYKLLLNQSLLLAFSCHGLYS